MDALGARPMRHRSHACNKALLRAEPHDFIRIGRDDDLVQRRTPPYPPIYPGEQWGAGDLAQYLADRKSTRLNSSHTVISYAVFCLTQNNTRRKSSITDSSPSR